MIAASSTPHSHDSSWRASTYAYTLHPPQELIPENFEVLIEFAINGRASGHTPYGDGFAMWLTHERATAGPVFGNRDHFTGLGIIFDTFANARHVS